MGPSQDGKTGTVVIDVPGALLAFCVLGAFAFNFSFFPTIAHLMPHPWICPFCPLQCDDVTIERQSDGGRQVVVPQCVVAQASIDRLDWHPAAPRSARLQGAPVDRQQAIEHVAARFDRAGAIAVRGSFTGLNTTRALIDFAERFGAAIEHDASVTQDAVRRAVAREGVFSATLGDVRRFADLVVLLGEPERHFPRLLQRFAGEGLVDDRVRRIVALDPLPVEPHSRDRAQEAHAAPEPERLPVPPEQLSDFLAALRMAIRQPSAGAESLLNDLNESAAVALRQLHRRIEEAQYVAIVLGPTAFDRLGPLGAEVEAAGVIGSVAGLNAQRRGVLLSLDRSHSFRQAALWRSGFAGPVVWQQGTPDTMDPARFADLWNDPETVRLSIQTTPGANLAQPTGTEGDSACRYTSVPCSAGADVMLAVDGSDEAAAQTAEVYLPISAPGIELSDIVVRGDGSVTLPLRAMRNPVEPTLAETLTAISEASAMPAETETVGTATAGATSKSSGRGRL